MSSEARGDHTGGEQRAAAAPGKGHMNPPPVMYQRVQQQQFPGQQAPTAQGHSVVPWTPPPPNMVAGPYGAVFDTNPQLQQMSGQYPQQQPHAQWQNADFYNQGTDWNSWTGQNEYAGDWQQATPWQQQQSHSKSPPRGQQPY